MMLDKTYVMPVNDSDVRTDNTYKLLITYVWTTTIYHGLSVPPRDPFPAFLDRGRETLYEEFGFSSVFRSRSLSLLLIKEQTTLQSAERKGKEKAKKKGKGEKGTQE